jgi:4-amino-4-deoxy-L-arabinose transferase-like glycosyltransferase
MTFASFFAPGESSSDAAADRRSAPLWLAVLALAMFLPGFLGMPPMDRDEPRFAQATKQMIETGDYVSIRFQNEARNKKPVGVYWLQAAAVQAGEALGVPDALTTIWLYRIPSLLGAIAAVLLTYWTGLAFLAPRAAALAAVLLTSTILLGVEARLATTDAVLAASVVAAMGALGRIYLGRDEAAEKQPLLWPFVFWTAIGAGVLVKGPITPMIPALCAAALSFKDRSARWLLRLRPVIGLIWALAIAAPWLVLISLRTHGAFLSDSIGGDMLAKAASAKEAHGAPPGTYFAAFWLTAWPMAPFAAIAAPFVWRARAKPEIAFLLAWLAPAWIVFELVPTKLPHYVLPLYPAVALLIALSLDRGELTFESRWRKWTLLWVPALAALLLGGVIALGIWRGETPAAPALVAAPLIVWRILAFVRGSAAASAPARIGEAALLAFLAYFAVYSGVVAGPLADRLMLTPQLVAAADEALQASGCPAFASVTTSYREPSLVFLTRGNLQMTDAVGAAKFLAQGPCRIAFVGQDEEKAFTGALPSSAGAPTFRRVRGYNFSRGRWAAIDVWARGK